MAEQVHKRLTDEQMKMIVEKYPARELSAAQAMELLDLKRRQFFEWVRRYRNDPEAFTIDYGRKGTGRKSAIRSMPISSRNWQSKRHYRRSVNSRPVLQLQLYSGSAKENTTRRRYLFPRSSRGQKNGYYIPKPERAIHDREVITHHAGELIQHDSSYHRWSPYIAEKFYLITSLDDYSRYLFYADITEKESSWAHIIALESVCTRYGLPLSYYVDNHAMFRFLEKRDTVWTKHHLKTDETDPQWKQVLQELRVKVTYALSPQAKGKIERPYRWLQDRIVRTCARENIQTISQVREILSYEVKRYNEHQVHSTTGEIPRMRLERAIEEGQDALSPI